jgi:hypothetical protein
MADRSKLARLQRAGIRRGVFGTSRPWLVVAILTTGARLVRRLVAKEEDVVLRETLQPGETLLITHTGTAREDLE